MQSVRQVSTTLNTLLEVGNENDGPVAQGGAVSVVMRKANELSAAVVISGYSCNACGHPAQLRCIHNHHHHLNNRIKGASLGSDILYLYCRGRDRFDTLTKNKS